MVDCQWQMKNWFETKHHTNIFSFWVLCWRILPEDLGIFFILTHTNSYVWEGLGPSDRPLKKHKEVKKRKGARTRKLGIKTFKHVKASQSCPAMRVLEGNIPSAQERATNAELFQMLTMNLGSKGR